MFTLLHSDRESRRDGFTLIELLTVMAIIAILASLIMGALSYAQFQAAKKRTETEIQGMQSALESYKTDNAVYPRDNGANEKKYTDALDCRTPPFKPTAYQNASKYLYGCLSGDYDPSNPSAGTNYNGQIDPPGENAKAAYFKFRPDSLARADLTKPVSAGNPVLYIMDGFGNSIGYSTAYQAWVEGGSKGAQKGVNPTYDLWSTGGDTKGAGTFDVASQKWIKNW